jgi:hypothetical protein
MKFTLVMWVMKFEHALDQIVGCGVQLMFGETEVFEMCFVSQNVFISMTVLANRELGMTRDLVFLVSLP